MSLTPKTISGNYPGGYLIKAPYNALYILAGTHIGTEGVRAGNYSQTYTDITNAGVINGDGILAECPVSVANTGTILGSYGIVAPGVTLYNNGTIGSYSNVKTIESSNNGDIVNGGYLDRGALLKGLVMVDGTATIANFGLIEGELTLFDGGSITNGAVGDTSAFMGGSTAIDIKGGAGAVTNFGLMTGYGNFRNFGVYLDEGGEVTNGGATDTGALIQAYDAVGIFGGLGAVTNWGAIVSVAAGAVGYGVELAAGGALTNGAATDKGASITGYTGVEIRGGAASLTNFGTITGQGVGGGQAGLVVAGGGTAVNGGGHDTTALIQGATGLALDDGGAVSNFGTVDGQAAAGVYLGSGGGTLANGGGVDRVALVTGYVGVTSAAAGTVTNQGVIEGTNGDGVDLLHGGKLANGGVNNPGALIEGYTGAALGGGASATNLGVIEGQGVGGGYGVSLAGGSLTNGDASDKKAVVEGYVGVSVASAGAVTNFGSIIGEGGKAVVFGASTDVLNVEAGSVFVGSVNGDGGILDLASGAGTIVLAGSVATVSGSMATTPFTAFGTVRIAAGASFKVSGDNTGILSVVGGTLTSDGSVSGTGHVNIDTGLADLGAGFEEAVDFTGTTGELELGASKTYTGKITGFSKTGATSLDLLDIAFAGTTTAVYTGTTTSGVLTVTEGANTAKITLEGNYLSSTFTVSAAPGGGTLVIDPPKAPAPAAPHLIGPAPTHQFIAAMAGFGAPVGAITLDGGLWRTPPPMLAAPRARLA